MKPFFYRLILLLLWMNIVCTGILAQHTHTLDSLKYQLELAADDAEKVQTLIAVSNEYAMQDLSMGLKYAERSLDVARSKKDDILIADALMNMGYVCFRHGLLELAVRHYYEYLDLKESMDDREGVRKGLINIAAVKLMMQDFEGARDDLLDILDMLDELDTLNSEPDTVLRLVLPTIYNNLGVAYENLENTEEAIDYYMRGASLARRIPDQLDVLARLLNNLGKLYGEEGRTQEALTVMNEALEIRITRGNRPGEASSYRNLALFHFDRGDHQLALEYAYKGLEIAERLGSLQLLTNFSGLLYEHFDRYNQPDSALKYHKQLKDYTERMNSEEVRQEITRMEVTAQFQERELLRQMEQKRKEQRLMYGGGLVLLIAVILGLLFFLAQSRARRLKLANTNILLESDKNQLEREKLENELEIKNKELTTNVMYQIRKNELINEITKKLLAYSHSLNRNQQELMTGIIRDLEKTQDETVWEEFEVRFHQVHNDFYEKLHKINPDLSLNERRLCAFLRLNMTTKEISSITGQSLRSIEVARTRLRKKLHLTNSDISIADFLLDI